MTVETAGLTVLVCRGDSVTAESAAIVREAAEISAELGYDDVSRALASYRGMPLHLVGRRPKRHIDALLSGRVLVIGDDADLNAVVLRLLRKKLLGEVEVAFAAVADPAGATDAGSAVAELYRLPVGADAVPAALVPGSAIEVPLVRNDSGGVLVGAAELRPITGTFYVDEERVPPGPARTVRVYPDVTRGLRVTTMRQRRLRRAPELRRWRGRAVEFGIVPGIGTQIRYDGITHPRDVKQWVFYRHTEPLRLVAAAPGGA